MWKMKMFFWGKQKMNKMLYVMMRGEGVYLEINKMLWFENGTTETNVKQSLNILKSVFGYKEVPEN